MIRDLVSKSKRRYVDAENGIDLDLSYINNQIIAMGFPSEGSESMYRNPMSEVQRMLEMKHKDRYKVYNLCSERSYDHKKFHHRVVRYPFDDHNCPRFNDIWKFCVDVKDWLDEHVDNIAVIHCKAGKGRTGLMICCWLLFIKDWERAEDAMKFYAAARTFNQKGVTIPSQIRYIHYFERRMRDCHPPSAEPVTLSHIILHGQPKNVQELKLTISALQEGMKLVPVFHYKKKIKDILRDEKLAGDKYWTSSVSTIDGLTKLVIPVDVELSCDIRFEFEKLMHFWINTGYISKNYVLPKKEIDKAHKDKKHRIFMRDFKVELCFKGSASAFSEPVPPPSSETNGQTNCRSVFGRPGPQQQQSQLALHWVLNNYRSLQNL